MEAPARTHARTRIDMWLLAAFAPFFGVQYLYQFCCHHHAFDCDCGHTATPAAHCSEGSTRHRSPAPVLQHLVPATKLHSSCSNKTSNISSLRHPPRFRLLTSPTLLSVYPPPVASTLSLKLFWILILLSVLAFLDLLVVSISVFSSLEGRPCDHSAHSFFRVAFWSNVTLWLMVLFRRV